MKFNFRIHPYKDIDTTCAVIAASKVPVVVCIDMNTAKRIPVPLLCAWHHLWQYVLCNDPGETQQIFSGRPIRLCKALISLIRSRIYS